MKAKEFLENSVRYENDGELRQMVSVNDAYWAMKLAVIEELEILLGNFTLDDAALEFIDLRIQELKKGKLR